MPEMTDAYAVPSQEEVTVKKLADQSSSLEPPSQNHQLEPSSDELPQSYLGGWRLALTTLG